MTTKASTYAEYLLSLKFFTLGAFLLNLLLY